MNTKEYKRGRTDPQILTKAIEKAIAGGWDKFGLQKHNYRLNEYTDINDNPDIELKFVRGMNDVCYFTVNDLIFNHDFAKALWGDKLVRRSWLYKDKYTHDYAPAWEAHLQSMVISDDPIKYLGEHLDD